MRAFLATLASALLLTDQAQAQCSQQRVRREWHDLSRSRQEQWAGCVRQLYDQGEWTQFQILHAQMNAPGHGNDYFLLFHRVFLWQVEEALASVGCNFGLPYFDSSAIYNRVWDNDMWEVLGTQSGCTEDEYFGGMVMDHGGCLNRRANGGAMWASAVIRSSVEQLGSFSAFAQDLENGAHAVVHNNIGGSMSSLNDAALDPLFVLHHCFVDYLWASWQNLDSSRYMDIGRNNPDGMAMPWENMSHSQVADYRNSMCYSYANPSAVVGGPRPSEEEEDNEDPEDGENPDDENDNDENDDEDDEEEDEDNPSITVPEDQLEEGVEFEEPPPVSEEFASQFNLDPEQIQATRDRLNSIKDEVQNLIKEGRVGDLWDVVKGVVKGTEDSDDEGEEDQENQDTSRSEGTPDQPDDSSAGSLSVMGAAVVMGLVVLAF